MPLTLTRKVGTKIVLTFPDGSTIEVFPTLIRDNQVRISIDAPESIGILREEVLDDAEFGSVRVGGWRCNCPGRSRSIQRRVWEEPSCKSCKALRPMRPNGGGE